MLEQDRRKRKKIIIISSGILVLFISVIGVNLIINNNKKTFGDTVDIIGLSKSTQNKPDKEVLREFIQYEALRVVNLNSKEPKTGKEIEDAVIREGSFEQSNDSDNGLHRVTFILDIKSLKQSYDVSYGWTDTLDASNNSLTENISYVKCLPDNKLIYGDFNCVDFDSVIDTPSDSIIKHLPYSTVDYVITLDPKMKNTLNIVIITSYSDEKNNPDGAIIKYKQDALAWIRSIGFDPLDFTINYTIQRPKITN